MIRVSERIERALAQIGIAVAIKPLFTLSSSTVYEILCRDL